MKPTPVIVATLFGTILQVAMVVIGHFLPAVRELGFAIGGMGFSLLTGLVCAWRARANWGADLAGGAIAGGLCALVGIAVSVALGDVPPSLLAFGTLSSVVTGLIGGAVGRLIWRPLA